MLKQDSHCVKWGDVCHSKQKGGLGIRPLCDINKALKAKWLWRFAKEDNTLWKNMVKVKYDVDRLGWWSKKSPHPHGVGCWKLIISGLDHFNLMNFEVKMGLEFYFGYVCGVELNLSRIDFWISLGWYILKMQLCNKWRLEMVIKITGI